MTINNATLGPYAILEAVLFHDIADDEETVATCLPLFPKGTK